MDNLSLNKTQVDVQLLRYILILLNIPKKKLIEISNSSENTDLSRFISTRHAVDTECCECNQLPKYKSEASHIKNTPK